ncbi:hypothetical protein [Anaerotruncus sp.]|uniref:hypothetical protein n=1 Tax=Anaerotruncus sp. TaxID=1872531 RepID=UPI0025BAC55B|nr:hypothetical protein [Anaerotruncus sp.]MCR2024133.1 hypothetical protein [Anaerotruncus colihominis]
MLKMRLPGKWADVQENSCEAMNSRSYFRAAGRKKEISVWGKRRFPQTNLFIEMRFVFQQAAAG